MVEVELENLPDEHKALFIQHMNSIRTKIFSGKLKTVYHFLLVSGYTEEKMRELLDIVETKHQNGCKLNVAFGMFLKNIETEQLRFFHPSNNTTLFKEPKIMKDKESFTKLLDELEIDDVFAYATTHRPSTKWTVDRIVCVRFDVYKTN